MSVSDWNPAIGPGHLYGRVARTLRRIGDGRMRAVGFAKAQLPVLVALRDGAKLSQAELVRVEGGEQPSMAQLLARMERNGNVRREPDPDDRRSSFIVLTDAARDRLPEGCAVLVQINAQAMAALSDDEVETLTRMLHRVLANVEVMDRD